MIYRIIYAPIDVVKAIMYKNKKETPDCLFVAVMYTVYMIYYSKNLKI